MRTNLLAILCWLTLATPALARDTLPTLWQIGRADASAAEFALAPGDCARFLQSFGSPDRAFYIGLSKAESDWPYALPGPLDGWGGSSGGGRWDQMNTLPVGFVLAQTATAGQCALILDIADTHPARPPRLRITINGAVFDRELRPGGSENSLHGNLGSAKPQVVEVEFPTSLLKPGYNEIALRTTGGSWLVFDALRLETPAEMRLAPVVDTVVRSITSASYALSAGKRNSATVRVEVYRAGSPGKLNVQFKSGVSQNLATEPGLQVFEVPAPVSASGKLTRVRVSADGQLLHESQLNLRASPPVTPADYVDPFKGTAHSRWMIGPGPSLPFSMVKISPDNQTAGWCAGYEYTIEAIDCFSHVHEWTMAGLGMMPTVGPLRTRPGLDGTGYSSRFDKASQRGGIGFYEVLLKDTGIHVALTATTRASLQEYNFPASDQARVIFDFDIPTEYKIHVLDAKVRRVGPAEIEGTIQTDVPEVHYNGDQRYDLHFVTQFSRPFDSLGGWQEEVVSTNVESLSEAGDCGAFVEFKTRAGEKILARTGISLVSVANARVNLERELAKPFGWNFAAVVQNARRVWNEIFQLQQVREPIDDA